MKQLPTLWLKRRGDYVRTDGLVKIRHIGIGRTWGVWIWSDEIGRLVLVHTMHNKSREEAMDTCDEALRPLL